MYYIQLQDGRWIKVAEVIYNMWTGNKKTKNHCQHVEAYWNEMYSRADAKYYNQMMEG